MLFPEGLEDSPFFEFSFFFFALFPSKIINIYRIARIFQNFVDYPGFQKISGVPILLQHSVILFLCNLISFINLKLIFIGGWTCQKIVKYFLKNSNFG